MDAHEFEVIVSESSEGARMQLVGRMDSATVGQFRMAMIHAVQKEWPDVVLDFSRVEYIDSSAMGNLLYWRGILQEHQRSIALANCEGAVLKAFKVGGFHKLFEMR
jgi:anti-anti-sigma factor